MTHAARSLAVAGLWKRYGAGPPVVRDVSFDLVQGEFLTLLGPSGSGKSTTLMMVAGFEAPSAGTIRVDGVDIAARPPEERNFGVVFQSYALFPHMTVQENVEFPLRMKRVPRRERRRRAADMLERVGLAAYAGRRPRALSGGQQQRVALARALVFEPDALLLDEPLGALDRKLREDLQSEIKDIQRRLGLSILFVTHDQDEAMMMSDRIAVMQEGRIVQLGTPEEIYLRPATPFVAGFLGETNFLAGTLCAVRDDAAQVRVGETLVPAQLPRAHLVPQGAKVRVAIRPERIFFVPPGDGAFLHGAIARRTFLGRHARFRVTCGAQDIVVSLAQWPPPASLCEGTTVALAWHAEDAQILPDDEILSAEEMP